MPGANAAEAALAALGERFLDSFDDAEERKASEAAAAARRARRAAEARAAAEAKAQAAKRRLAKAEAQAAARARTALAAAEGARHGQRADPKAKAEQRAARKALLSSDIDAIFAQPQPQPAAGGEDAEQEPEDARAEFASLRQEVLELGATQLDKKAKKEWERRKLKALGARDDKAQKMPVKMLAGMRKKQAQREARRAEEERQSGVITGRVAKPGSGGKGGKRGRR